MMKTNRAKERLYNGEVALGTLSLIPEPTIPELVGSIGYDFYVIDTEHTALDGQGLASMIRGCDAGGITPIVRIRNVDEKSLLWLLDTGAQGVMIPLVDSTITARRAHELTHYPPHGTRTMCSATRAANHGALRYKSDLGPFFEHSNQNMLLIGLIESPEGVENIEDIAREDLDVFTVGRGDLSVKMGLSYAPRHERVEAATRHVLSQVMAAGKVASVLAYDEQDAQNWIDFGCRLVIYNQPEMILANDYSRAYENIRKHGTG